VGWQICALSELSDVDRSCFDCGKSHINNFLKDSALTSEKEGLCRVFVLINDDISNEVAGFYTLGNSSIRHKDIPDEYKTSLPFEVPAILIGQFALDVKWHGTTFKDKKLSENMLWDIYRRSVLLQKQSPAALNSIKVDTNEERAFNFWKKQGFILYKGHETKERRSLFLPIKTIVSLLGNESS
jgi:hypothetical protein